MYVIVDPCVAASNFLETNQLPAYYLDQVAEFIIKNAGVFQGQVNSGTGDPFTGEGEREISVKQRSGLQY